jgi:hypothetical protein
MGYGCGDCFDAGKRVGDDVVLAGYVTNVRRELGYEVQLVELVSLLCQKAKMDCGPSEL